MSQMQIVCTCFFATLNRPFVFPLLMFNLLSGFSFFEDVVIDEVSDFAS